jgi:hypothetical protein
MSLIAILRQQRRVLMFGLNREELSAKFRAMQRQRALAVLIFVLVCIGTARSVIEELKKVGNKTILCMHTGLTSDLKDCGVHSGWYTYVFVGSISVITPTQKDEVEIQIAPEEVFAGEPASPLTVRTSQGPCFPNFVVGDRWLFYLRQEKGKPIVLDYYGNDSRPAVDAQKEIENLRHLKTIGNLGIVRGHVVRGKFGEWKAVPRARVVARRISDIIEFVARTDVDGQYEFEPLPPGEYNLAIDRIRLSEDQNTGIDVSGGACWDLTLSK